MALQAFHRGMLLHDNTDGTFTQCGVASEPHVDSVVVSRGPPDPSAPPPVPPTHPLTGESLGNSEESWKYIQGYLKNFQGPVIPTKGWIPALLTLHRVRQPDWNVDWLREHPYSDSHVRDVAALLVQLSGEPAPTPCNRCSEGKGIFRSCVMVSVKADSRVLENVVSCANCYYHSNSSYCSHRQWGAERNKKVVQERHDRFMKNVEQVRKVHLEVEPETTKIPTSRSNTSVGASNQKTITEVTAHQPEKIMAPNKQPEPVQQSTTDDPPSAGFLIAEGQRRYDFWPLGELSDDFPGAFVSCC
jgi:hypothetical protein